MPLSVNGDEDAMFGQAMLQVADKAEYLRVQKACPELILAETPPQRFLAFGHQNIKEACKRMAKYWKLRSQTFGPAVAPLEASLTDADRKLLHQGPAAVLPCDGKGRAVLFVDCSRMDKLYALSVEARHRACWFLLRKLCDSARKGVGKEAVAIACLTDASSISNKKASLELLDFLRTAVASSMCLEFSLLHMVAVHEDGAVRRNLLQSVSPAIIKRLKTRTVLHVGSPSDVRKSLQGHDLDVGQLPRRCGGDWDEEHWKKWLHENGVLPPPPAHAARAVAGVPQAHVYAATKEPRVCNQSAANSGKPSVQDEDQKPSARAPRQAVGKLHVQAPETTARAPIAGLKELPSPLGIPVYDAATRVPGNDAYIAALRQCPNLVHSDSAHKQFLAYCGGDVLGAAVRLTKYWSLRVEVFGNEKAYLPLWKVLTEGDKHLLRQGIGAVLPPDRLGRPVFVQNRSRIESQTAYVFGSRLRVYWFVLQDLCKAAAMTGVTSAVFVAVVSATMRGNQNKQIMTMRQRILSEAMCIRFAHMHVIAITSSSREKRTLLETVVPVSMQFFSSLSGTKAATIHSGSEQEVVQSLKRANLDVGSIPAECGGKWTYESDWTRWLDSRIVSPPPDTVGKKREQAVGAAKFSVDGSTPLVPKLPESKAIEPAVVGLAACDASSPRQEKLRRPKSDTLVSVERNRSNESPSLDRVPGVPGAKAKPPSKVVAAFHEAAKVRATVFPANNAVEEAMRQVPEKAAYLEALKKGIVETESPHRRFLRFCEGDANDAARRLARYWALRVQIFGARMAFSPLTQAMTDEDKAFLSLGFGVVLPPDGKCRPLLYIDRSRTPASTTKATQLRAMWFLLHSISETLDSHAKCDAIYIAKLSAKMDDCYTSDMCGLEGKVIRQAMCVRFVQLHVIALQGKRDDENRAVMENVMPTMMKRFGHLLSGTPTMLHAGSVSQLLTSMQAFGAQRHCLPNTLGGTWSYEKDWIDWLKQRFVPSKLLKQEQVALFNVEPPSHAKRKISAGLDDASKSPATRRLKAQKPQKVDRQGCYNPASSGATPSPLDLGNLTRACVRQDVFVKQVHLQTLNRPNGSAYAAAAKCCPAVVLTESPPSQFLSFCENNTSAAAQRLAFYWSLRLKVFGPNHAFLPTSDGLSSEDRLALASGFIRTLREKTREGHFAVMVDSSSVAQPPYAIGLRVCWVLLQQLCEEGWYRSKMTRHECGIVLLYVLDPEISQASFDPSVTELIRVALTEAMCGKLRHVHFLVRAAPAEKPMFLARLVASLKQYAPWLAKLSATLHCGSAEEVRLLLLQHGIQVQPDLLPASWKGTAPSMSSRGLRAAAPPWPGSLEPGGVVAGASTGGTTEEVSQNVAGSQLRGSDGGLPRDAADARCLTKRLQYGTTGSTTDIGRPDAVVSGSYAVGMSLSALELLGDVAGSHSNCLSSSNRQSDSSGLPAATAIDTGRTSFDTNVKPSSTDKHPVLIAMSHIPDKAAFTMAMEACSDVVMSESPPDRFLSFCHGDAIAAATRLATYWKLRTELFGARVVPLAQALTSKDCEHLERGSCVVLPCSKAGHTVLFVDRMRIDTFPVPYLEPRLRSLWFMLQHHQHHMQVSTPSSENIVLIVRVSNTRLSAVKFDREVMQFVHEAMQRVFCFRLAEIHFVSVDPPRGFTMSALAQVLPRVIQRLSPWLSSLPARFHMGSRSHVLNSLSKHGLESEGLPSCCGGSWSYQNWQRWLLEHSIISSGSKSVAAASNGGKTSLQASAIAKAEDDAYSARSQATINDVSLQPRGSDDTTSLHANATTQDADDDEDDDDEIRRRVEYTMAARKIQRRKHSAIYKKRKRQRMADDEGKQREGAEDDGKVVQSQDGAEYF